MIDMLAAHSGETRVKVMVGRGESQAVGEQSRYTTVLLTSANSISAEDVLMEFRWPFERRASCTQRLINNGLHHLLWLVIRTRRIIQSAATATLD